MPGGRGRYSLKSACQLPAHIQACVSASPRHDYWVLFGTIRRRHDGHPVRRLYSTTVAAVPRSVVFFDIGGVLFSDPWQTLLLTRGRGLADRLGLDRETVSRAGHRLWTRYATAESTEDQYWRDLARELGIDLEWTMIDQLMTELLYQNPRAHDILEHARRIMHIGIISDNTTFWYKRQADDLKLQDFVEPDLVFLSCRLGVSKETADDGLFAVAATRVKAQTALVVDNDSAHAERAERLGFQAIRYAMGDGDEGFHRLVRELEGRGA